MSAVHQNGMALRYAPKYQNDISVVISAITQNPEAIRYASKSLMNDKYFLIKAVNSNREVLNFLNNDTRREVEENLLPMTLDKEKALQMLLENCSHMEYISKELQNDKDFIKTAVSKKGDILAMVSPEFKACKDIVMAAVEQRGFAILNAENGFRNDKDVVMAAVKQNGRALMCASNKLKNDKDVVMAAIKQDYNALRYASNKLKKDKEFICCAIKQNKNVVRYIDKDLLNELEAEANELAYEMLEHVTDCKSDDVSLSEANDILEVDACPSPMQINEFNDEEIPDR